MNTTQTLTMFKTIIATLIASVYAININATAGDFSPCSHATSIKELMQCWQDFNAERENGEDDCDENGMREVVTGDGWINWETC